MIVAISYLIISAVLILNSGDHDKAHLFQHALSMAALMAVLVQLIKIRIKAQPRLRHATRRA